MILLLGLLSGQISRADTPAFDLNGPRVDVRVARAGKTLPISQVATLAAGDRLWLHPDFPESQSARYLLIVAFLRGATNPPPENWFTRIETWKKDVHEEGVFVNVPAEAQQALIFLAPETGGDFNTLRNAVRGKPGVFVRSTQDLQQASYDRMRLEKYLAEVRSISDNTSKSLHDHSLLIARSLSIKIDQQCFDKPTVQQVPCLMQNTDGMVLDDAHSQTVVSQWTSGASVDLINQVSASQLGGGGVYSAYVGAIVDLAKIMGQVHTAQYQYIPALAMPQQDSLNLKLNTPPSFRNPKSVLVIPLPPVQKAQNPPLHLIDAKPTYCSKKPGLIIPVDGAPLVFATAIAHDLKLKVPGKDGKMFTLSLQADPLEGGLVVDASSLKTEELEQETTAKIEGQWGFDSFSGPEVKIIRPHSVELAVAATDKTALIVGRDDTLHFSANSLVCLSEVNMRTSSGESAQLNWKAVKDDAFEVTVPLKNAQPGTITLQINQYGLPNPDELVLNTYSEAAHLDSFWMSSGDVSAVLKGKRLDEVASVDLKQIRFTPADLRRVNEQDELILKTDLATDSLKSNEKLMARVKLKDGRVLEQAATIAAARPRVTLVSKTVQADSAAPPAPVKLGSPDDLPENQHLVFVLKSEAPANFPRTGKIEIAAVDGSFAATLTLSDGSLVLQDAQTALAVLDPVKSFGPSAFGPLQLRPVDANGLTGDWIPVGTLVRLPVLKDLHCIRAASKGCTLSGANLFLVTSIASDSEFKDAVEVPQGFTGANLPVPFPAGGALYLKLRDDPNSVHTAKLPITYAATPAPVVAPASTPGVPPVEQHH